MRYSCLAINTGSVVGDPRLHSYSLWCYSEQSWQYVGLAEEEVIAG